MIIGNINILALVCIHGLQAKRTKYHFKSCDDIWIKMNFQLLFVWNNKSFSPDRSAIFTSWYKARDWNACNWSILEFLFRPHHRLRAIRGVPSGVVNFTSHFIVIQIFQILFLPPVSFYTHPNISDIFVGDEINLFNRPFRDITNY